jgi:hypothetical protein
LVDFELSPFWFTIVTYFNSEIVNILNPLIHDLHLCFLQPFLQHIWLVDDSTVNQSDSVFYIKKSVSFGRFTLTFSYP